MTGIKNGGIKIPVSKIPGTSRGKAVSRYAVSQGPLRSRGLIPIPNTDDAPHPTGDANNDTDSPRTEQQGRETAVGIKLRLRDIGEAFRRVLAFDEFGHAVGVAMSGQEKSA